MLNERSQLSVELQQHQQSNCFRKHNVNVHSHHSFTDDTHHIMERMEGKYRWMEVKHMNIWVSFNYTFVSSQETDYTCVTFRIKWCNNVTWNYFLPVPQSDFTGTLEPSVVRLSLCKFSACVQRTFTSGKANWLYCGSYVTFERCHTLSQVITKIITPFMTSAFFWFFIFFLPEHHQHLIGCYLSHFNKIHPWVFLLFWEQNR